MVREQPWGRDVREVLLSPGFERRGKTCREILNAARRAHLPAHTACVAALKFMSYAGLNAKVYGGALPPHRSSGMNTGERLEEDGGDRYGIKRGRE